MIGRISGIAAAALTVLSLCGCAITEAGTADDAVAHAVNGVAVLDAERLSGLVAAGKAVLIDVRTAEEFAAGHIAGAVNMPIGSFDPAAVPFVPGKQTVLYCRSGKRSREAAKLLAAETGRAVHLAGGTIAWTSAGGRLTLAD